MTDKEFWQHIERRGDDECWLWTGARNSCDYGNVKMAGKWHKAHRVAWRLSGRDIEPEALLLHSCDTPLCCNPAHMRQGTHADNTRDKVARGRQWRMPGELHPSAKLTERTVYEIRRAYSAKEATQADLARQYHVHDRTISRVVRHETWTGS